MKKSNKTNRLNSIERAFLLFTLRKWGRIPAELSENTLQFVTESAIRASLQNMKRFSSNLTPTACAAYNSLASIYNVN